MPVESLLPLLLSVVYASAALLVWPRPSLAWRGAGTAAALACVITVFAIVASAKGWIKTPALVLAMLSLVSVLGAVIVRYSRRYLDGEAGQPRYVAALLITLGAVSTLVVTDHLGLMLGAWIISSFALHHLLTFYRDRPAAQSAAHKKFIASRLAELSMFGALLLIHQNAGTLSIEQLGAQWRELPALTGSLQVAAVLLVFGAMLKSAQLPLHGWLIQVMEAPTPVSALLHAGVVNIGGYVLIRLASLLELAPAAQALLVIGGSLTAVLASLVMITRISIKVRLAWSTCAQMGFMLMECGLGLYELAFLHLLAHSLYKAHAFLSAGSTVDQRRRADLAPVIQLPSPRRLIVAGAVAMPLTMLIAQGSALLWQVPLPGVELPAVALVVAALGLAHCCGRPVSRTVAPGPGLGAGAATDPDLAGAACAGLPAGPARCQLAAAAAVAVGRRTVHRAVCSPAVADRLSARPPRAGFAPACLRRLPPRPALHAPELSHLAASPRRRP